MLATTAVCALIGAGATGGHSTALPMDLEILEMICTPQRSLTSDDVLDPLLARYRYEQQQQRQQQQQGGDAVDQRNHLNPMSQQQPALSLLDMLINSARLLRTPDAQHDCGITVGLLRVLVFLLYRADDDALLSSLIAQPSLTTHHTRPHQTPGNTRGKDWKWLVRLSYDRRADIRVLALEALVLVLKHSAWVVHDVTLEVDELGREVEETVFPPVAPEDEEETSVWPPTRHLLHIALDDSECPTARASAVRAVLTSYRTAFTTACHAAAAVGLPSHHPLHQGGSRGGERRGVGFSDALTPAVAGQLLSSISDGLRTNTHGSPINAISHPYGASSSSSSSLDTVETPSAVVAGLSNLLELLSLCRDADLARPALLLARAQSVLHHQRSGARRHHHHPATSHERYEEDSVLGAMINDDDDTAGTDVGTGTTVDGPALAASVGVGSGVGVLPITTRTSDVWELLGALKILPQVVDALRNRRELGYVMNLAACQRLLSSSNLPSASEPSNQGTGTAALSVRHGLSSPSSHHQHQGNGSADEVADDWLPPRGNMFPRT